MNVERDCRLSSRWSNAHETVAIVGAEQLLLSKAMRRVASVVGRRMVVVPWPVWAQFALAQVTKSAMKVPLGSRAQHRALSDTAERRLT
ncbi:hypothetical protein [Agromyces badenianii]|uniref:hypothetical protein n=1 Tax=Agromyces badenianii TaxID=2080742 RepID=UPI000D5995F0|nr:hypothetical protein [Agromyces badenianii]PWC03478.1 hypothetical protein DCE94_10560 [Agromyces badenianii]